MGRIVTNKYKNGDIVTKQDFYNGIVVDDLAEKKRIAMGRIILTVGSGTESIWILNENDVPKIVAQSLDVEIPAEIREYISEKVSEMGDEVKEYADEAIAESMETFLQLVVSSADTMYSELKGYIDTLSSSTETVASEINSRINELSAYTMNLKLSDHFMLTEDEYRMLSMLGELTVDADEEFVSRETRELNDLHIGDVIKYSEEIYYCIYDENGGGGESGNTPMFSGSTMEIFYDVLPEGHTIILDDSETISGNTMEFSNGGGSETEISDGAIEDDSVHTDEDSEHTLVLGDNYTYDDEENNTFIIN